MTQSLANPVKIGRFTLEKPLALAPMCGITDVIERPKNRKFGASLCFTQMVSAEGYVRESNRTRELLDYIPADDPLGVQIFGSTPEVLARVARDICDRYKVQWIDLNMGCPVRKVACHEAGSGLLKNLPLVRQIWEAMRKALPNENFTVKVRAGWDDKSLVIDELAEMADGIGLDLLTIHPRTRAQGYSGQADWSRIARLKERCKTTPVFGSGDLLAPQAIRAMMEETGIDGCSLARGAIGNPWIFSRGLALLEGEADPGEPTNRELFEVICDHLRGCTRTYGDLRGVKMFRPHLAGYLRGRRNATQMRRQIFGIKTAEELEDVLRNFLMGEHIDPDASPRTQNQEVA